MFGRCRMGSRTRRWRSTSFERSSSADRACSVRPIVWWN
jgi:hypothetical protein